MTIRRTERRDAPAIAALHAALVPSSLWAELGTGFLATLYDTMVGDPRFVSFVHESTEGIGAFLAGSIDTGGLLRATARRKGLSLAVRALPHLRPALVRRLIDTGRYPRARGSAGAAESLFCAVLPELRRQGIAAALHDALERELAKRRIDRLVVTTEASNAAAREHLAALGFVEEAHFEFYGKDMVRHAKRVGTETNLA